MVQPSPQWKKDRGPQLKNLQYFDRRLTVSRPLRAFKGKNPAVILWGMKCTIIPAKLEAVLRRFST